MSTMTKVCETPTAKQRRVWDKAAPSYDKQIAFFERISSVAAGSGSAERARGRVLEVAIGTGAQPPTTTPTTSSSPASS